MDQQLPQEIIQQQPPADLTQQVEPTEAPPQKSIIDQIDKNELAKYILDRLKDDVRDRDGFGWVHMREYDQLAYDGYKKKATDPWNNAANYAVCLTPTLVDTAHANVIGSIYSDKKKIVTVDGVGPEDIRTEKHLDALLNWQIINDIEDAYDTIDKTVSVSFKNGNGAIKVIQGGGPQKSRVLWSRVPFENIFVPITARGAQRSQTDHIFELIPLSENDKNARVIVKDPKTGKPVYDGMADLQRGSKIVFSSAIDSLVNVRDQTSGTSLGSKYSNDMFYILECYLTYWHKPKEGDGDPVEIELIVWIAPQGGRIMRMVENSDVDEDAGEAIRPYSLRWIPYPREDRIYGDSLPWMVKQTQEELDYAHNQNMNAAEELIKPYKFYDPGSGFDPEAHQQTPNGWYPIPNPRNNVYIPDMRFDPIFERQFERYWEYAQRRTGLTELFQGRTPDREQTLGEAQLRTNKTEIRFKTVYERFEQGFKELIELTYFFDKKYMPRDTKIKVLGATEYQTLDELFPKGVKGRYNFSFSSAPVTEKAQKNQDIRMFYAAVAPNPLVAGNPANDWKMMELLADSYGIRNLGAVIGKPKEANVLSPQEAIQRIMSGELDVMPDPGIDCNDYMLRIQMFMKGDAFADADPQTKQAIMLLLRRVDNIRVGQQMAAQDAMLLKQHIGTQGPMGPGMPGEGMQGGNPGGPPQGGQGAPV